MSMNELFTFPAKTQCPSIHGLDEKPPRLVGDKKNLKSILTSTTCSLDLFRYAVYSLYTDLKVPGDLEADSTKRVPASILQGGGGWSL